MERRRKKIDVQRKEMEERTRHMRLMRHKVETADLTTRWHGVGGAEVPRRDLRTMRRARRVPEHNAFSTAGARPHGRGRFGREERRRVNEPAPLLHSTK